MASNARSAKKCLKWEKFWTPPTTLPDVIRITRRRRNRPPLPGIRPVKPRLLMLVPTATYRAEAFVRAAQSLPIELSIASEVPSSLSHLHPVSLPAFDFARPARAITAAREFAASTRVDGVVAVDDQSVLPAALIAAALGLRHHPVDA